MSWSTDEFQVFGDYVAYELRNLKTTEHQCRRKLDVQRAILRASEIDVIGSSPLQSYSSFSKSDTPSTSSAASYVSDFDPYERSK